MPEYLDALETRDPEIREREQLARLPLQIAHAKARAPAYSRLLADIDPEAITSRSALAAIPVTRKADLASLQKVAPPFGGYAAVHWGAAARVFASPGPIFEPEGRQVDYWRFARSLFAAGFRAGDLVHNCFSYHFTPAGSMFEGGAISLGCTVFPGGVGQTEQQLQAMMLLEPSGYIGTPSFLKIIVDRADAMGASLRHLRKALVSGEALPALLAQEFQDRGIDVYQAYGTADIGSIAYETEARAGFVVDEGILLEILRPGTPDPVEPGEIGEVVVTTLHNEAYPLIRFGTGDLSVMLPGGSPCGRTNVRIKGWMGRADQTTKVRGMFVHPAQVTAIVGRHPQIRRARLIVDSEGGLDRMLLHVEVADSDHIDVAAVAATIREVTKLRGEVVIRALGELPADGKAIDDIRQYDRR
ncbi:MAG: AMP-binding protein [Burkholderiales bacterium]|nr:AMP-binding protein [Burkholderiales bacterium]